MPSPTQARAQELASKLTSGTRRDVRVTVRLSPDVHGRLKEIQAAIGASSVNDVVRNALFLYDALVAERREGNEVLVKSRDGGEVRYPVFD